MKNEEKKKEKKEENQFSREIILNPFGYNKIYYYLPSIYWLDAYGFDIKAILPKKIYEKWVPYIHGIKEFRERVSGQIREIFSKHKFFRSQSFIEISWSSIGIRFNMRSGCILSVLRDGSDFCLESSDVFGYEQASILFIALSIYLSNLYSTLEQFENGTISSREFIEEEISERIELTTKSKNKKDDNDELKRTIYSLRQEISNLEDEKRIDIEALKTILEGIVDSPPDDLKKKIENLILFCKTKKEELKKDDTLSILSSI